MRSRQRSLTACFLQLQCPYTRDRRESHRGPHRLVCIHGSTARLLLRGKSEKWKGWATSVAPRAQVEMIRLSRRKAPEWLSYQDICCTLALDFTCGPWYYVHGLELAVDSARLIVSIVKDDRANI